MRVINHNWSATKQRLHPQSVAEISRHSVLPGDRTRQCETPPGSRHKDTDQRPQAAISLRRHRTVVIVVNIIVVVEIRGRGTDLNPIPVKIFVLSYSTVVMPVSLSSSYSTPGRVSAWMGTVEQVNHRDTEPGIQVYSARAILLWVDAVSTQQKAGRVNRHITRYTSPCPWSCSVGWCSTEDWLAENSADVREAVAR